MRARQRQMAAYPTCEVGPVFTFASMDDRHGIDDCRTLHDLAMGCCRRSHGIHERVKRSAGGSLTDPAGLMGSCNPCNMAIEDHPRLAHALGLVLRAGDPGFDELRAPSKIVPRPSQPRSVPG